MEEDRIWRVRVKVRRLGLRPYSTSDQTALQEGREQDVVVAILQKSLDSSPSCILSAFTRDKIHGWVYVETADESNLAPLLRGIPGVARRKQGSFIGQLVDLDDRPMLLDMSLNSWLPSLTAGSWVHVKRGLYKGDLGLVEGYDSSESCSVLLVPRLTMSRKRKLKFRPPKALFDEVAARNVFGEKAVEVRNQLRMFRKQMFSGGFLIMQCELAQLSLETAQPSQDELELFRLCEYWAQPSSSTSPLQAGDRILIRYGTLQGSSGFVVEANKSTVRFSLSDNKTAVCEVQAREVRKNFAPGDFVEVLEGPERGATGFVVDTNDVSIAIYSRTVTMLWASRDYIAHIEEEGCEAGILVVKSRTALRLRL